MRKKGHKDIAKEELADDERELFLNALEQGILVTKESQRKPAVVESDSDLFLRAINEGIANTIVPKIGDDQSKIISRSIRKRSSIDARIDLHGMFVDDAIHALLRFIERERLKGAKTILVIHGKGSGALKKAVWSLIETHPYVGDFQVAPGKLGGAGAILLRIQRT